jgi:hypothetical protein
MNRIPAGSRGQMLALSDLKQILDDKLGRTALGYAFVLSYKEHFGTASSAGYCRTSADLQPRPMTIFEKYNIASVTKPISAAALIMALADNKEVHRGKPMWRWLPRHWEFGLGIKDITFLELMTHTSGIRADGRSYAALKTIIKNGIDPNVKTEEYLNANYALLRLIIPKLARYDIFSLVDASPSMVAANEPKQAQAFADAYIDFCRKRIFEKVGGMPGVACRSDSPEPALFYSYAEPALKGRHMGDQTLNVGSGGWVMSTAQMADVFRTIHHTNKVMPAELSAMLREEELGLGINKTSAPVRSFVKGGSEDVDGREYGSAIMLFENGVQIAMMSTSGPGLKKIGWEAFSEWYA